MLLDLSVKPLSMYEGFLEKRRLTCRNKSSPNGVTNYLPLITYSRSGDRNGFLGKIPDPIE